MLAAHKIIFPIKFFNYNSNFVADYFQRTDSPASPPSNFSARPS